MGLYPPFGVENTIIKREPCLYLSKFSPFSPLLHNKKNNCRTAANTAAKSSVPKTIANNLTEFSTKKPYEIRHSVRQTKRNRITRSIICLELKARIRLVKSDRPVYGNRMDRSAELVNAGNTVVGTWPGNVIVRTQAVDGVSTLVNVNERELAFSENIKHFIFTSAPIFTFYLRYSIFTTID